MMSHLYKPGKFSDHCQVMLARYPCPYPPEEHPHRVQLSRRKGWRKPENTVVVARPSKWGNPFPITDRGREHAIAAFRAILDDAASRAALDYPEPEEIRAELAGKNLACWCPLDQPCHADVLLEIANGADQ